MSSPRFHQWLAVCAILAVNSTAAVAAPSLSPIVAAGLLVRLLPTADCNTNGTDDTQELPGHDCNTNNTLDVCDMAVTGGGNTQNSTPVVIPDLASVTSTVSPAQQQFVTDTNVLVNIRHTATGNLTLSLAHYNTTITLASALGGTGDNFANTLFDQQAATSITAASPPFTGTFRPQGNLDAFNGLPKTGIWTLTVQDSITGDTGTLLNWSLLTSHHFTADCNSDGTPDICQLAGRDCNTDNSLDDCELLTFDCNTNGTFDACEPDCNQNGTPDICDLTVLGGGQSSFTTPLPIQDIGATVSGIITAQQVFVSDVNVQVNIRHTATGNLRLSIVRLNTSVLLADRLGGGEDNFSNTVFDDQAPTPVTSAASPFTGTFAPQGHLSDFNGLPKAGLWTLVVEDMLGGDSGTLLSWTLITQQHAITSDCNSNGIPDSCELAGNDCNTDGTLDRCQLGLTGVSAQAITSGPINAAIPNNGATGVFLLNVVGAGTITDVNLQISIQHPADNEMNISLHKDSVTAFLITTGSLSGSNLQNTVLDDQAPTIIGPGNAPYSGTYRPAFNTLSRFNGLDRSGTWILYVADYTPGSNSGTLLSWSLFITSQIDRDCNTDGVLDECNIASGAAQDSNHDGILDVCQDCNTNGTPDQQESGFRDCNTNGRMDACDIALGAPDCNSNGVIDACDPDCNTNGQADACELLGSGAPADCDTDGVPDVCGFTDCNSNSTPDVCELLAAADCDTNGVLDACELATFIRRLSNSPSGAPADLPCRDPAVSSDGRFVAFYSASTNLTPNDSSGFVDVFVADQLTGTMSNIHHSPAGAPANGNAYATIDMSPDGRFVAFTSKASNLGANGNAQLFLFDRQTSMLEMISVTPSGQPANSGSYSPAISADGRYVAFESTASDIVPNDTNGMCDVFRRDRVTHQTIRISVSSAGIQANNASGVSPYIGFFEVGSRQVVISEDGSLVCFASNATNLISNKTIFARGVYTHDCRTGETALISATPDGSQPNQGSSGIDEPFYYSAGIGMSPDGRFIAFDSSASNLVPGDTNNRQDLFVRDRLTNSTSIVPLAGSVPTPLTANPAISRDGRYITFVTNLGGLVPDQAPPSDFIFNVFRFDRVQGHLELLSRNVNGIGGNGSSGEPDAYVAITPDARVAVFASYASNLTSDPPADPNAYQLFVCVPAAAPDANSNGTPDACEAAACLTCPGDINTDQAVDALDIPGWVRCSLAVGQPGDACPCTAGLTPDQFITRLLQPGPTTCP